MTCASVVVIFLSFVIFLVRLTRQSARTVFDVMESLILLYLMVATFSSLLRANSPPHANCACSAFEARSTRRQNSKPKWPAWLSASGRLFTIFRFARHAFCSCRQQWMTNILDVCCATMLIFQFTRRLLSMSTPRNVVVYLAYKLASYGRSSDESNGKCRVSLWANDAD